MEGACPLLQINAPFASSRNIFLDVLRLPTHHGNRIEAKWYSQTNRVVVSDVANFPGSLLGVAFYKATEEFPD